MAIGQPCRSAAASNLLAMEEIDKQEAEIKIKKKKVKGEAQEACVKCGIRHKKARSRKLFHLRVERWGTFKIKYSKPKQSSVLVPEAKNWTESHRKDQNLYSAFSFFSKTLFDFKKSISGLIELKFSGKTPNEVLYAPIYFWVSIFSLRA